MHFKADHDALIEIYIFSKKLYLVHICVKKITWELKGDQTRFGNMFLKDRIFNLLDCFRFLRCVHPSQYSETECNRTFAKSDSSQMVARLE